MPLLSIFRIIGTLLSLAVLAGTGYLLWRWWQGSLLIDEAGREIVVRQPWMLWLALGLGVSSFLGKFFWTFVLAGPNDAVRPERGTGAMLPGADGAQLYVETTGRTGAPAIVLTHGAGMDSTAWYLAKRDLGQDFQLITWDLPGLGKSRHGTISLESYAENLRIVVQSVGRPVVVVGHSMGGMAIQTLARQQPQLFRASIVGTVLLNTTYTNPLKTMILAGLAQALKPVLVLGYYLQIALLPLSWLSAWQSYLSGAAHIANRLTFGKGVTRTQLDHVALLGTRNSPAAIARGNLAMINWDATGAVAKIPHPVLLIAGDGDIVTKPEASSMIASTALEPRLATVENSNHMSFLDHATTYHTLIEGYAREAFSRAAATPSDAAL